MQTSRGNAIMSLHDDHDDFGGLHRDLRQTGAAMGRRKLLRLAAGFGASLGGLYLLGCKDASATGTNASCTKIPDETAGPYPGDSSNGPNVLNLSGVVRNDI